MPKQMYRAVIGYKDRVELRLIESESKAVVYEVGSQVRHKRETAFSKYCDTFEEAKTFLITHHDALIREYENKLRFVRDSKAKILLITEPMEVTKDDE